MFKYNNNGQLTDNLLDLNSPYGVGAPRHPTDPGSGGRQAACDQMFLGSYVPAQSYDRGYTTKGFDGITCESKSMSSYVDELEQSTPRMAEWMLGSADMLPGASGMSARSIDALGGRIPYGPFQGDFAPAPLPADLKRPANTKGPLAQRPQGNCAPWERRREQQCTQATPDGPIKCKWVDRGCATDYTAQSKFPNSSHVFGYPADPKPIGFLDGINSTPDFLTTNWNQSRDLRYMEPTPLFPTHPYNTIH
jgi:hypothetical protein